MTFGSALHSGINAFLTGQDGFAVFELFWLSYEHKELEYGRYRWKELAALGMTFLGKFKTYHLKKYKLEFAESRLYAEYRGVKFEGTLDYLGQYEEKRSLRDFKTSGRNYESEKSLCAIQLNLYAYLATQNSLPAPETLGYTVFNKAAGSIQNLTWDFSEKKMYETLDEVVNYTLGWDKGFKGDNYPKNYNACLDYNKRCPFWAKCHEKEGN